MLLGVGRNNVTRWESGKFKPTLRVLKKLFELFIKAGMEVEDET
jgi:transcriptional regulator with XRE-family HTH domain